MGVPNPVVCLSYGKPREIPHYIHVGVCTIGMHVQKVGNGRQYAIGLYLGIERSEAYGSHL